MAAKIRVGDTAPNFTATDQAGNLVELKQACRDSVVVLYFYPHDHSPHCVAQAVCFREQYHQFNEAGARVLGISHDSQARHLGFVSKYQLPYTLLTDGDGEIHRLYGVPRRLGILPGRVTFVLDQERVVQDLFVAQFQVETHVSRALAAVQRIAGLTISNTG